MIGENNDLVALGFVSMYYQASLLCTLGTTDNDLVGVVLHYSIAVYNHSRGKDMTGLVGIDSVTGSISLLASLDAQIYRVIINNSSF